MSKDAAEDRPPNVVLILTDDQGYADLGFTGNPFLETPNTDRVFEAGANFTDFHVCPTCSPTRAALMTGRHNLRTGVWHTIQGRSILRRDEMTMADVFRAGGYRTGIFGKWHLGDNYPHRPRDRGFETAVVHGGGGVAQTPDHWGNDYFDDVYDRNGSPEPFDGYCTDVWFEAALGFIERCADAAEPFFCYIPTNAAHRPYQVPEAYAARYRDEVPDDVARFYGMITNIDDNVGRLCDRLEELGVRDETILLYLTDNGSSSPYFNPTLRGHKGSQYDGGHRVPLAIHWPGHIEGRTIGALSAHFDLLPTLADYCSIEPPSTELDGRSLRPLLTGADTWPDRTIVVDSQRIERPKRWRNCAVMTDRWRLVDGDELYDMAADPSQREDVAADFPAVVERLRAAYEAWWADVSDRFDEPSRIVIGGEEEPVALTCMDWHECDDVPWNQPSILRAPPSNGHWTVAFSEGGTYEFALRRWPPEASAPIDGVPSDAATMRYGDRDNWNAEATAIDPESASLTVGDRTHTAPVPPGSKAVRFEVTVDAGPSRIRSCITDEDGVERGAYFVEATRRD